MARPLAQRPLDHCLVPLCEQALADALRAVRRDDEESLHDLRVALRRLRVFVTHYARPDRTRRKVLRQVVKVMKVSNASRDSEVMLAWLARIRPSLESTDREGANMWRRTLRSARGARALKPKKLLSRIALLPALIAQLVPEQRANREAFAKVVARHLQLQYQRLQALRAYPSGEAPLHAVRLEVKSLRYLLSPFVDALEACREAYQALQLWQDRLGEWHDALLRQQHLSQITREIMDADVQSIDVALAKGEGLHATRLAPAIKGLVTLLRINGAALKKQEEALWQELHGDGAARLERRVQNAIASLSVAGRV